MKRALWILGGCVIAVAAGVLAVWVNSWFVDPNAAMASSGMHAFADLLLFLAVAGVVGMVPTWMLLRSLPRGERPWTIVSTVLMVVGATALLAAWLVSTGRGSGSPAPTVNWSGIALLRLFLSPVLVLIDGVAALAAPSAKPRWRFVAAAAAELVGMGGVFVPLLWMGR